ncbi:unnamed protein product [Citrullus colocynthis]|uniref:Uncharacterized protein n=1 Tax=Citrullus colocynthis TaxID=252529 RepID=A0ABP0XQV3_9ROSI
MEEDTLSHVGPDRYKNNFRPRSQTLSAGDLLPPPPSPENSNFLEFEEHSSYQSPRESNKFLSTFHS